MRNKKLIGYTAAILSTLFLGAVGIFVRNISANGYIITFARLGFGLVFLIVFLSLRGEIKSVKIIKFPFSLTATGMLLATTSVCYINAINSGPLANAVFLLYLGPLLAVGLASILLKEKFTYLNAGLLLLAFIGFLFLLEFKFSFDINASGGYLWGIISAMCYALYIILNRKIPEDIPTLTRSFYQLLAGTIMMLPFLDASIFNITVKDGCWLMAIGFFHGFLSFTLIILALKHLKTIEYGTISYIEPLVASLIGFGLYSERLTLFQSMGCVIIFAGGMIQVISQANTNSNQMKNS